VSETRKLAAILVADIVGYSRLAGADEDRILARLRTLRSDLIDPILSVHHGRVVKRTGDGAIIEFRSVVDAVRCAIEVQSGLAERNAGLPPEKRIEYRVGIHLGDVVEEADGDLMGDGVNIAARLEGVAQPGTICLSEDAYRQVSGRLDMEVTDLGPTQLKNIERSIRVYSLQVGVPAKAKAATQTKPPKPKVRSPLALLGAGIVALVLIAAGAWYVLGANRTKPVASNAPLSIVVLPFANLSGDPTQDYLADALTDQLTTGIARLADTFVIARNTAFTYKGKPVDAKAIGKDLGVRYVLEGSVQPSGAQVRVNAQLIDAEGGAHVWADQFDTPRVDLLQMQDEIVTRLAHAIDYQTPFAQSALAKRTPPSNPDAEDLALRCLAIRLKVNSGQKDDPGYSLCEQALAIDPNNTLALDVLAFKYLSPVLGGLSSDRKGDLQRADEMISKALSTDPNYGYAHHTKAMILGQLGRLDEAIAEDERALALDPSIVEAYLVMGSVYRGFGQFEKSNQLIDKAIRLSPRDQAIFYWYKEKADTCFALKQYDQAIEWARRSTTIDPSLSATNRTLIAALALTGRAAEAREALQRYLALPNSDLRTIAAVKALNARITNEHSDPRFLDYLDRRIEGYRKAGMPEG
jgi:TolB-like protein/class 3 adenylate cyclase/Tfp pilus assembly protein PilF